MALKPAQGKRRAAFKSSLGEDKLVLSRFDAREAVGELFEIQVETLSDDKSIDFDKILGSTCSIRINSTDGKERFFNGTLTEAQSLGPQDDVFGYRLVLRPWFWLLTKTANCKIFKEKSVKDIISDVLGKHSFAKCDNRLSGSYPKLEYCVQYCESDFDFLCRLMEENGIYYFFDHTEDDHQLVLADAGSAHKDKFLGADLPFVPTADKHFQNEESLNEWSSSRKFCSGKFSVTDFNYLKPTAAMLADKGGNAKYQNAKLEVYHYPGRHEDKGQGEKRAGWQLEAEQAMDQRCEGGGDAVSCSPGGKIKLSKHPQVADGSEFLILRAAHMYRAPAYRSSGQSDDDTYYGRFEFLPIKVQYRSPQLTPAPRIVGPQTAIVTGSGEIDVDEHGRIEVMFHWSKSHGDVTSRRVRISHGWSGSSWGDIKIPRVGMEVVVEFLNGDPDQPLVTGTVYNGVNKVPYPLPGEKTISGVKSKTDGGSGYNEFIFDDKSGSELVRLHAQKDMDGKIEHDEKRDIGNDVKIKVGNNRNEDIGMEWTVVAGTKIMFTCGQSKITMTPASIDIESVNINIKAQAMLTTKSVMTQAESSGPTIVKGMPILLN
jgi:type VI secretion system secreted protein VgrG